MMRTYELMVVLPTEESEKQAGQQQLAADLAAGGAEIAKTDDLGDKTLAYEVQKRRMGRYILYTLRLEPAKIAGIDKAFKLNSRLLKYLFIRLDNNGEAAEAAKAA